MKRMRAVHLALASKLPTGVMLEEAPVLDSRYLSKILQRVALDHPDKYSDVVKTIGDIGRRAAYIQGESMGIADLRDPIDTRSMLAAMDSEVAGVKGGDPDERRAAVEDIWLRWAAKLERESMGAAKLKGNAVADSVASGARGKPLQLRAMLSTPAVFEDSLGKIVPIFARSSYSAGVSPTEMLAGTYGARKSVTATKTSTAKGGFWSKMVGQAAADVVVTEEDCGTQNGIDLDPSDTSLRNRVLAKGAVGLEPGSLLDRKAVATLQNKSKGPVIVRSALTCESKHGICAKCAGAQPDGKLPEIGFNAGITAAQSLGEPVCLHGSTLVRMANGSIKPITEIVVGDLVLGSDMRGKLRPTRVVNTFVNGMRHCYKTVVRKGFGKDSERVELISTLAHKVLSFHGNRKKEPASVILPIEAPANKAHRHVVYMTQGCDAYGGRHEPLALMLGLMTGDGSYTGNLTSKGIAFSCYDPELEAHVKEYLAPHRLRLSSQGKGEFRVSAFDQHREFEIINGVKVRNKLKHLLTVEKMWGQSSGNKTAPVSIWEWDNASVAAYVGGLIATDGWITHSKLGGVVGIASNSKALLVAVKEQLEVRFGLFSCRISPKFKKRPDGTFYAPTYELVYCGKDNLSIIQRLIPVPGCKQARLDKLAAVLPEGAKKSGRFAVMSQTYVGFEMTYDIEVDNETHLFALANGLIVSNTQASLNCLVKGTMVRMADFSEKPIEEIKVGDLVLGSNKKAETFPVLVSHVWNQGLQPVEEYTYRQGGTSQLLRVKCTAKHEILSNRKCSNSSGVKLNKTCLKLQAGDPRSRIAAVLPVSFKASKKGLQEPFACLLGVMLGDGIRLGAAGPPKFSCADPELIRDLTRILAPHKLSLKKCKRSLDYKVVMLNKVCINREKSTGQVKAGVRHPVRKAMAKHSMLGTYAFDKELPGTVAQWSDKSALALLSGYLATDGSLGWAASGTAFISMGSSSATMLTQIKQLLAFRFGIHTGKITQTAKPGGMRKHALFALTVTRADMVHKLAKMLPPIPGCKEQARQKMAAEMGRTRLNDTFVRANRIQIKSLGAQPCYDITVAHPDELFVLANGLIVSNTKHLSGAASAKRQYSGLDWLARFVQVPDNFPDRAPLSEEEGFVSLEDAPQGGHYVRIGKSSHYVPQHLDLKVKNGQHVERGEQLSDGIVRPDDVVHTRGLGEGRRYYATRLKQMLDEGGTAASSRQTEIVARGAVNHVRLRDADDFKGYLPDDAVRYNDMLEQWEEAEDTEEKDPEASVGQFLQSPALHYTVGTRISPSMAKRLKTTGFSSVRVSSKEPPFADEMLRLQTQAYANTDWLASQHSSYLGRQLSDAARRGQDTKLVGNTHFAPALARGVDFGKQLSETGRY